ncbi:hypothetical protein HKT18_05645 [Flavobacterium sp. IMCC34852]|uniref:Uncharacterized protein n=1 Tax=Flavobacterium rivulicola TaxID=2732161 RepID=A0A7Y3R894_9FLAO|nr:hypothetical protein [Flavobacterium sp. IMCC34852]NNT71697.1 hypothetical protein [Flavobacterium sp. IMCC34852]
MSQIDRYKSLPIYQKAELIFQLVESLVASLPEDDDYIQDTKHLMLEDAMIIPAKIVGAEAGDLYSIRMQNAALIREYAMHLYVQVGSLAFHDNYKDLEYIKLIRKELEEFRILFIEWVESFDTNNHLWDDWGLFNPSGAIPPSDEDTDFDINDFFEDED